MIRPRWQRGGVRLRRMAAASGFTDSGIYLAGVCIVSWLAARLIAGQTLYVVSYACAGVLAVSWAIGRKKPSFSAERAVSHRRATEHQAVQVDVRVTGSRFRGLLVEETLPPGVSGNTKQLLLNVGGQQGSSFIYHMTPAHRGAFRIGPLVAGWSDPFGLTRRSTVIAEPFELIVHPRVESVWDRPQTRLIEDAPIRPPVARPWPHGLEFSGIREYAAGDDLRRVVWRAVARTGRLLVRESEQGLTDSVKILLDNQEGSSREDGEPFETAVRAAASLGVDYLTRGYSVSLLTNDGATLGPLGGPATRNLFLDALARLETSRRPQAPVLRRLQDRSSTHDHVVVITCNPPAGQLTSLGTLVKAGMSVLVVGAGPTDAMSQALAMAAKLGCRVAEISPRAPLATSFSGVLERRPA